MWSTLSGLLGIYVPVVRANARNKQKTQYDLYGQKQRKTHAKEGDRKGLMELTSEQRWIGSEASATRRAGGTAFQAEGRASAGAWRSPSAAAGTNSKASSCPEQAARGKRQRSWGDDHVTTRTRFYLESNGNSMEGLREEQGQDTTWVFNRDTGCCMRPDHGRQ